MMGTVELLEEDLRQSACIGDEHTVMKLVSMGVNVNSMNNMNGWTALHWAAARRHKQIVKYLLQNGANPKIKNKKGETPAYVTEDEEIHNLFGERPLVEVPNVFPITPSYLKYPCLPVSYFGTSIKPYGLDSSINNSSQSKISDLVLKARIANGKDPDFIEIVLKQNELTLENLIDVCCKELEIEKPFISKIRKLPNTTIRKDKDVERLSEYQEIEIVPH